MSALLTDLRPRLMSRFQVHEYGPIEARQSILGSQPGQRLALLPRLHTLIRCSLFQRCNPNLDSMVWAPVSELLISENVRDRYASNPDG